MVKTNAMRILDLEEIDYKTITYEVVDNEIDGISVAKKIGRDFEDVYKTLLTIGSSGNHYIFVIPVAEELDFKLAAKLVKEKSIELENPKKVKTLTGYNIGGCSPIGLKKEFPIFLSKEAEDKEKIIISAGKIGVQIEVSPEDLIKLLEIEYGNIIKDKDRRL